MDESGGGRGCFQRAQRKGLEGTDHGRTQEEQGGREEGENGRNDWYLKITFGAVLKDDNKEKGQRCC